MYTDEGIVMTIVKQRMNDAMRYAEHRRALPFVRPSRASTRVRVGMALIRLGRWLVGGSWPSAGSTIGLEPAN
jgi:hypothetical protein